MLNSRMTSPLYHTLKLKYYSQITARYCLSVYCETRLARIRINQLCDNNTAERLQDLLALVRKKLYVEVKTGGKLRISTRLLPVFWFIQNTVRQMPLGVAVRYCAQQRLSFYYSLFLIQLFITLCLVTVQYFTKYTQRCISMHYGVLE